MDVRLRTVMDLIDGLLSGSRFILVINITMGSNWVVHELLGRMRKEGVVNHPIHARSYYGTERKAVEVNLNGLRPEMLNLFDVVVCDDIVDSGATMGAVLQALRDLNPDRSPDRRLVTFCMLRKPGVLREQNRLRRERGEPEITVDYVGLDIPDDAFVVGRGMDYFGFGRSHMCVYKIEDWSHRYPKDRRAADDLKALLPLGTSGVDGSRPRSKSEDLLSA